MKKIICECWESPKSVSVSRYYCERLKYLVFENDKTILLYDVRNEKGETLETVDFVFELMEEFSQAVMELGTAINSIEHTVHIEMYLNTEDVGE